METRRQPDEQRIGRDRLRERVAERGGGIVEALGRADAVDADADDAGEPAVGRRHALGEQAGDLGPAPHQVVRPFQAEADAAEVFDRLGERDAGDEADLRRERRRTGIDDERAGVEIARRRAPEAALAAAPVGLLLGDDPQPARVAGERRAARFVVGRADAREPGDPPAGEQRLGVDLKIDCVQNSDFAAAIAASVSGAGANA